MSQVIETLRETDPEAAVTLEVIALEYMRRRHEPGCSMDGDDAHTDGKLGLAGLIYAWWTVENINPGSVANTIGPPMWPFAPEKWKPRSLRFALISVCSYALAELTRLIRAGK